MRQIRHLSEAETLIASFGAKMKHLKYEGLSYEMSSSIPNTVKYKRETANDTCLGAWLTLPYGNLTLVVLYRARLGPSVLLNLATAIPQLSLVVILPGSFRASVKFYFTYAAFISSVSSTFS